MSGAIDKKEILNIEGLDSDRKNVIETLKAIAAAAVELSKTLGDTKGLKDLTGALKALNQVQAEFTKFQKQSIDMAVKAEKIKQAENDTKIKSIKVDEELLKLEKLQEQQKLRNTKATQAEEGSYDELNATLNQTVRAYKALSQADRENAAIGGEMIKTIQAQDMQLKQLDATMGKNQRNVGNYKSGFNGLNFSIMQIGRELPSLAYGFNVFVGALSNNIPMMTDEIRKAQEQVKILKAEGQAFTPVWKQILSSVFSLQTLMVVGITLFTMYGREIAAWTKELFKSKNALDQNKIAQDRLNEANKKGYEDGQKDLVRLKLLYNATQSTTISLEEKQKAIKELQDQYPDYLGKFSQEEILAGKAGKAYYELANAIMASAKAKAYEQIIVENEVKKLELETKVIEERKGLLKAEKSLIEARKQFSDVSGTEEAMAGASSMISAAQNNVDKFTKSINGLNTEISAIEYSSKELADKIKPTDLLSNLGQGKGGKSSDKVKDAKEEAAELIDINDLLAGIRRDQEVEAQKEFDEETKRLQKDALDERKAYSQSLVSDAEEQIHNEALLKYAAAKIEIDNAKGNAEKIKDIQQQLEFDLMESERRILQAKLDSGFLIGNDAEQVKNRINAIEENIAKKKIDTSVKSKEEKQALLKEELQATNEFLQTGLNFAQQIYSAQAERAQQAYESEMNAAGDSLEAQIKAKRKFEAEDKKIKQRQAVASKLQAVLDASLALALAIATTWKNPLLAALNIGAATLGLGMALATPIPQYATGTKNSEGTFIAGEKKSEIIVTPEGDLMVTPNKATLYSDPKLKGSTVIPHDETTKFLANLAMNNTREIIDMSQTNKHLSNMEKSLKKKDTSPYINAKGKLVEKRGSITYIHS